MDHVTQVQRRDCVERHVLAGTERYQGPGMGNTWGEGREGSGLNGAEACKVSVVWGDYRRPLVVLGDSIGLLSPPPFSP